MTRNDAVGNGQRRKQLHCQRSGASIERACHSSPRNLVGRYLAAAVTRLRRVPAPMPRGDIYGTEQIQRVDAVS